jgi:hypothetical protein
MTSSITVYGSGDNNICLCGDLAEEIYDVEGLGATIEFGDGTDLTIRWTGRGTWEIECHQGTAGMHFEPAGPGVEPDNYTDRATLTGDLRWVRVLHGTDVKEYEIP